VLLLLQFVLLVVNIAIFILPHLVTVQSVHLGDTTSVAPIEVKEVDYQLINSNILINYQLQTEDIWAPKGEARECVITDTKDMLAVAKQVSTNNDITIATIDCQGGTYCQVWIPNFISHLRKAQVFNYMIFAVSNETCKEIHASAHLLPTRCCLEQLSPKIYAGPFFEKRKHPTAYKWTIALELLRLGYNVWFLDIDIAVLKNPFVRFHYDAARGIDFQGQTDVFMDRDREDNQPEFRKWDYPCPVNTEFGKVTCQSTGEWYAVSNTQVIHLIEDLVQRLKTSDVWEQHSFNSEILMWHTIGFQNRSFVRYMVQDDRDFLQMITYQRTWEKTRSLKEMDPTLLHLGAIHGTDKVATYQRHGVWTTPEEWEQTKKAITALETGHAITATTTSTSTLNST